MTKKYVYISVGAFDEVSRKFKTDKGRITQAMNFRGSTSDNDDPESFQKKIWEKQRLLVAFFDEPLEEFSTVNVGGHNFSIVYPDCFDKELEELFPNNEEETEDE